MKLIPRYVLSRHIFLSVSCTQIERKHSFKLKIQTVTMSHQLKLNCPICNYSRLTNLSRHLTTVHAISGKERKTLLLRACFSVSSMQPDQPQPSIPEADSTPTQFGNSLPKTSPLPQQKKLPNPTSDQTAEDLIPCPYDNRISYERIWGTNVPVMDYDIFKLHHPFSMLVVVSSMQPDQPQPSIPEADSTPTQFGNSLPETSPLPQQKKLPNPTSDQTAEDLILCPYDNRISYERIWGTNVPVMDYDIFKLHHPFSMLVAGPRGTGKSEFVKQLLSLKHFIMTNPPERILWFYGRHQPELFCSLAQEIPCIEFYEGLPTNIEVMFDRHKGNICIIDDLMQSASGNQLVKNLFTNEFECVCCVRQSKFILYRKEMQNYLFEFNLHHGFQESERSISNLSSSISNVPTQPKFLQVSHEDATKDPYQYILDFHPNSPEFARV